MALRAWFAALGQRLDQQEGLSARQQWIVLFVVALLLFSRLPILLVHAQFYAEDGTVWYSQA